MPIKKPRLGLKFVRENLKGKEMVWYK